MAIVISPDNLNLCVPHVIPLSIARNNNKYKRRRENAENLTLVRLELSEIGRRIIIVFRRISFISVGQAHATYNALAAASGQAKDIQEHVLISSFLQSVKPFSFSYIRGWKLSIDKNDTLMCVPN